MSSAETLPEEELVEPLVDHVVDADVVPPAGHPCPSCGCPVEPQDKFCPACGTPSEVVEPIKPAGRGADQHKFFQCNACGAKVNVSIDERAFVCPFCDSNYVVEYSPEEIGRQRPEFVIGFGVTPEQAEARFHAWITDNQWYRPGDLHLAKIAEKLRGVYLPFWGFSMLAESRWSASIGEYWYRTETYTTMENGKMVTKTRTVTETEWWPLDGQHHEYYSGYLVSASKGLQQTDADQIKPFNLPALKRYEPFYLAGWSAEEYSIEKEQAHEICKQEFYRREQQNIASFLPGNTHRNLVVQTNFSHENSDLCLLPVYLLSYRYQDKLYRFLVNGQTGKIVGDKPISWRRIGAVIGGIGGLLLLLVVIILILKALY
ncbi:zinc ribbon domain-containing protein [Blastopirellula marina]|uniref:Zinc ribbon domain-containing protein n=1 Tax=Blastopirellula marina DSM 3645 TaxID=314230 RepID=A3ZTA2_9BACT|nr:zinc ribbon domain-containing protein [Blastopirellula marina]EAQ80155.1 hypothetical protein DSM3645_19203 [Blastopirellula marina DSM 3645]